MVKKSPHIAFAVVTLCSTSVFAEARFGDYLTLSGFGTVGVVSSDNSDTEFVRDGAPRGAGAKESWQVDSKLGLQADMKANDWLSATVQVLAEQRHEPGVKAEFEWAFVKLKPLDGLNVRIGRIAPAMFMVSDARNVGYANTMVRQPNEVYSLALLKRLSGGDVSYSFGLGGTTLTVSGILGKSSLANRVPGATPSKFDADDVRGINAVWDTDYGSFRVGQVKTDVILPASVSPTGSRYAIAYTFTGIGYQWDNGSSVVAAEYVKRESPPPFDSSSYKGWYGMAGYRFGKFLPYAFVADAKTQDPLRNRTGGDQRTYGIGMRWDVVTGAAIKLQLERADPQNTRGTSFSLTGKQPAAKANALSLAVDFVF
jgi:hypothetical protein